jgi:hypothetical protein
MAPSFSDSSLTTARKEAIAVPKVSGVRIISFCADLRLAASPSRALAWVD